MRCAPPPLPYKLLLPREEPARQAQAEGFRASKAGKSEEARPKSCLTATSGLICVRQLRFAWTLAMKKEDEELFQKLESLINDLDANLAAQEPAYLLLQQLRKSQYESPAEFGEDSFLKLLALSADLRVKQKLSNGIYVKHISRPIEGVIIGVTRISKLLERPDDKIGYRVKTKNGIKICSHDNLEPLVTSEYVNRLLEVPSAS
jgi:hypothetical protein